MIKKDQNSNHSRTAQMQCQKGFLLLAQNRTEKTTQIESCLSLHYATAHLKTEEASVSKFFQTVLQNTTKRWQWTLTSISIEILRNLSLPLLKLQSVWAISNNILNCLKLIFVKRTDCSKQNQNSCRCRILLPSWVKPKKLNHLLQFPHRKSVLCFITPYLLVILQAFVCHIYL